MNIRLYAPSIHETYVFLPITYTYIHPYIWHETYVFLDLAYIHSYIWYETYVFLHLAYIHPYIWYETYVFLHVFCFFFEERRAVQKEQFTARRLFSRDIEYTDETREREKER